MPKFPADFELCDGIWWPKAALETAAPEVPKASVEAALEALSRERDLSADSESLAERAGDPVFGDAVDPADGHWLRAFDLDPGARALLIGARTTTIARVLGERCARVTVVDPDAGAARLARARCRDLQGVEGVVADFDGLEWREPWDLVVFGSPLAPASPALRAARDALRPGGSILATADNPLGLRYLAGARDDGLGAHFAGIEGAATGGRLAWRDTLAALGFHAARILPAFADPWNLTVVLQLDELGPADLARLQIAPWCDRPTQDRHGLRRRLFSERLALDRLASAGLLADHANAFVLLAATPGGRGDPAVRTPDWIACKLSPQRRTAYRTRTRLRRLPDGTAILEREPLTDLPAPSGAPIRRCPQREIRYRTGMPSLATQMIAALRTGRDPRGEFLRHVETWVAFVRSVEAVPGTEDLIPGSYLNAVPSGLSVAADGEVHFVDDEWSWAEPIPRDFVLFRGLVTLLLRFKPWIDAALVDGEYTFAELAARCFEGCGVRTDSWDLAAFARWEHAIQSALVPRVAVDYEALVRATFALERPALDALTELEQRVAELERRTAEAQREGDRMGAESDAVRWEIEQARATARREEEERAAIAAQHATLHREALETADTHLRRALAARAARRPSTDPEPCASTYDILIPIYNAYEHVKRCVESVLRHTEPCHRVYLLDDASPDARILPLLEDFAKRDARVRVLPSARNQGFVANTNRGFGLSRNPVVILNSDTEVTPQWLERMDRCKRSDENIAVVSPLSNNATVLSVPRMNRPNELPEGCSVEDFARLVAAVSPRLYPRLPTAVGFCMLIDRTLLDRVGGFDEAYGLGYGEECDMCMQAWTLGYEVACCDDAYVHHYGEASFSSVDQIDQRRAENAQTLARRWPRYHPAVFGFCHVNPMREIQERIATGIRARREDRRPHVLQVLHSFSALGGTEIHTRRIVDGLRARFRSTILYPESMKPYWGDMDVAFEDPDVRIVRFKRENAAPEETFLDISADLFNQTVEGSFSRFVAGGDYDVAHFQHLAGWSSLLLPLIAKAQGLKVILSLHDYFALCPDYNLVRPTMERCGKPYADGTDAGCLECLGAKRYRHAKGEAPLLHKYLIARRALVERVLAEADALIAPSAFVRDLFARSLDEATASKIRVVPHGTPPVVPSKRPKPAGALRVGFLGNLTDRKGGEVVIEAARRLQGTPVRIGVFGGVTPALQRTARKAGLRLHGAYNPNKLGELLEQVDLVLIPSVWDETFCLTLTEAQALGVPVVASDAGAISERIEDGETGFLVPPGDAEVLAATLLDLHRHRDRIAHVVERLRGLPFKSMEANAEDYAAIYDELVESADAGGRFVRALVGPALKKAA